MANKSQTFEPWHIPHRGLVDGIVSKYRVYKAARDFVDVEAESVVEALRLSGVAESVRVERISSLNANVLEPQSFDEAVPDTAQTVPPEAEMPEPPPLAG